MILKKFQFPGFEEFYKQKHDLSWGVEDTIGEFRAEIGVVSVYCSIPQLEFVARIINKSAYREICYHSFFRWDKVEDGPEALREWYEKSIQELNTEYSDYINRTYYL